MAVALCPYGPCDAGAGDLDSGDVEFARGECSCVSAEVVVPDGFDVVAIDRGCDDDEGLLAAAELCVVWAVGETLLDGGAFACWDMAD